MANLAVRAIPTFEAGGAIEQWVGVHTDVTEQRTTQLRLRQLNDVLKRRFSEALAEREVFAQIVDATDSLIQVIDTDMNMTAINRANLAAFDRLYGFRPQVGDHLPTLYASYPRLVAGAMQHWTRALAGESFSVITEVGDRARTWMEIGFDVLKDANGRTIGAFSLADDISERRPNDQRLAEAEEQLRQSQKMEAVGQLTGGVAHDFNNLLTVVMGNLDMARRALPRGDTERAERLLGNALQGAERAATLTNRLLAFSRRQPLDPKPTDVGRLLTGMSDLLTRSLGETVRIETVVSADLWRVDIDPPQLENAVLNLAINARDAMAGMGRLTIEAANTSIDESRSARYQDVPAGEYVVVCVSDTGTGMPPEVIAKAFDPFFTTKEVGKGTGLGLSQVYGFVKQSGGHVKIYSELAEGTTVKLYLPRLDSPGETLDGIERAVAPSDSRGETILVVEDNDDVRALTVAALVELGYRVLEAADGETALGFIERNYAVPINLLLTDVVMPEMSGRQLADEACARLPGLPVLFTTGYARNAIDHGGRLDAGVELLSKPFTQATLATKLRAVLDSAGTNAARPGHLPI